MKIGLLAVSAGDLELSAERRGYSRMFVDFFDRTRARFEFAFYDVIGKREFPASLDECDAYLVTGSKYSAFDDEPWIRLLCDFIRKAHGARKKLVGICFGHQVIAHALGGKVIKSPKGWGVGCRAMIIRRSHPWMIPPKKTVSLLYSHQDQVVGLPPEAEQTGLSDFCEQSLFVIGSNILCIQGHPEFTADYLRELMAGRTGIIPPDVYARGVASLSEPVDSALVGRWIAAFINDQNKNP